MPRRLAVSLWGLVLAAAAIPAIASPVHAASVCTGWKSEVLPPTTIRVFRTQGPYAGKVQRVNFRAYVAITMAGEWPGYWSKETLKAGAVVVKQYAWYRAMHWRGKSDASGSCYDVVDYWADQVYQPEKNHPTTSQQAAINATWSLSLRKSGAFFAPGYWAGEKVLCGRNADGLRIYQWSAYDCGRQGFTMEWILRRYFPSLSVVDPGQHDIIGAYFGDGGALKPGTTTTSTQPIAYVSTGSAFQRTATPQLAFAPSAIIGRASADVTGDGRDDLVILTADGTNAQSLRVIPGTATGYGTITRWWLARGEIVNANLRLVTGDFDADGRADAGLLAGGADGISNFWLMRSLGTAFATKQRWWSGGLLLGRTQAYAGDVTGDGKADLVVEMDRGANGLLYRVMPSYPAHAGLGGAKTMLNATELRRSTTRTVHTDVNRDGREDLVIAIPYGSGVRLRALRSSGSAFVRDDLWLSAVTPWSGLKFAAGDINGDGFGDVVLFRNLGASGTRVRAMRSSGSALYGSFQLDDRALAWSSARPY